jgi:hypothetical protein
VNFILKPVGEKTRTSRLYRVFRNLINWMTRWWGAIVPQIEKSVL